MWLWGASSVGVHVCAEAHAHALVMPAQPAVVSAALVQKGLAGLPALCPRVTAVEPLPAPETLLAGLGHAEQSCLR